MKTDHVAWAAAAADIYILFDCGRGEIDIWQLVFLCVYICFPEHTLSELAICGVGDWGTRLRLHGHVICPPWLQAECVVSKVRVRVASWKLLRISVDECGASLSQPPKVLSRCFTRQVLVLTTIPLVFYWEYYSRKLFFMNQFVWD